MDKKKIERINELARKKKAGSLSEEEIARYHQFDEFFEGSVIDVRNVDTFVVR